METIKLENENSVKDLIYSSALGKIRNKLKLTFLNKCAFANFFFLEDKRRIISQVNVLFTSINNNESKLIEQLKRPFVANSIKVESQYRR